MSPHHTPLLKPIAIAALWAGVAASALAQTAEVRDANPVAREKFTGVIADKSNTPTADVQAMRDEGMGWGAIANALGIKLGHAVSSANQERRAEAAADNDATTRGQSSHAGGNGHGGGNGGGNGGGGGGKH